MIIDCIADLHGHYPKLEGGDLLIVAGDLTARDTIYEHADFLGWLNIQKYKKKIFIAGNHDNNVDKKFDWDETLDYLCDSGAEFEGLKIWGSPWTKRFEGMNPHCMAFTVDTDEELMEKWAMIPDDVDVLVTHSPPWGIADENRHGEKCGSKSLYEKLIIVKPRAHIFGHIHECGYKHFEIKYPLKIDQLSSDMILVNYNKTHCVNASHVNEYYKPVNKPVRVIL